jgi:hypothetical protein
MADDAAFIWDQPTPRPATRSRPATGAEPSIEGRISLREAEHRFGIRVSTLRAWSRGGSIDAVRAKGSHGDQWMVTPESVAHRLSRRAPRTTATPDRATGPSSDGSSMLVPRDAWDKLMDQLGNLHEAGMHLADARERAAKAETEATFLRERLSEMRTERDELRDVTTWPRSNREAGESVQTVGWWTWLKNRIG